MASNYITMIVSVIALGGVGFAYVWLQDRAYDRKWGKRQPPAE